MPLDVARARLESDRADRLEGLGEAFQCRVRDGYRHLTEAEPDSWVVVDGTGNPEVVAEAVRVAVTERLARA